MGRFREILVRHWTGCPDDGTETAKTAPLQPLKTGDVYLLVDGYNVIHAWDSLKQYLPDHLELARKQLSDWLCNYQGFRQCQVILVFDAYQVNGRTGTCGAIS